MITSFSKIFKIMNILKLLLSRKYFSLKMKIRILFSRM